MNGHTVLIIEDDATLLRGLTDNYRREGYQVESASDGEAGLRSAQDSRPDLILLDIMLPRMNGFEVCRQLRSEESSSTIIMLTAKGQEEDIVRGLELGADDYVTKPFSIRELLARSRGFLLRKSEPTLAIHDFGDFRLDLTAYKLYSDDVEVTLTSKEFKLLEYMVTRAGRALSRRDILDGVWGSQVIVTTRSVDRCVTTLRGKIEADPRHPRWIKTIRDIGYRFEPDA